MVDDHEWHDYQHGEETPCGKHSPTCWCFTGPVGRGELADDLEKNAVCLCFGEVTSG